MPGIARKAQATRGGEGAARTARPVIAGVGVDIVDVPRLAAALERRTGLEEEVFTARERSCPVAGRGRVVHLAECLAAKEALLKAVKRGLWEGVPLKEIEVERPCRRQPGFRLGLRARDAVARCGGRVTRLTFCRQPGAVVAVVVVQ